MAVGCGAVVRRRAAALRRAGRQCAAGAGGALFLRRRSADRAVGQVPGRGAAGHLCRAGGGGRGVRVRRVRRPGLDPARAPGRAEQGGAGTAGIRAAGPVRRHAAARGAMEHGRDRPAHPEPATVRRHDRRQASPPRHRRIGTAGRCGRPRPGRGAGASGRGGAGGRCRPAAAGGTCGDQRAGGAGRGAAGVRAAGCRCRRVRSAGQGGGRGAAGRVRAAGRWVLGRQDPVRG